MKALTRRARQRAAREPDFVEVIGAREHNLVIDHLSIPKRQLVVFTGPSGSGKSSLAFDTLYAEGQRRYVETLSAYARQFLGQLERPKVDHLRGLSPTIAIEQKSASSNPALDRRHDHRDLRLPARPLRQGRRAATAPRAARRSTAQGAQAIAREILALPEGTKLDAPCAAGHPPQGRVQGALRRPAGARLRPRHDRRRRPSRSTRCRRSTRSRSTPSRSSSTASSSAPAIARASPRASSCAARRKGRAPRRRRTGAASSRSARRARAAGSRFPELSPQSFSFNSPLGMCPACTGLGKRDEVDPELVVPDPTQVDPRGRDRAVGDGDGARRRVDVAHRRRRRASLQGRPRHAVEEAPQGEAATSSSTAQQAGRQADRRLPSDGERRERANSGTLGHEVTRASSRASSGASARRRPRRRASTTADTSASGRATRAAASASAPRPSPCVVAGKSIAERRRR